MCFYDQKFELRYQDKINVKFFCDGSDDNLQNYTKKSHFTIPGLLTRFENTKGLGKWRLRRRIF